MTPTYDIIGRIWKCTLPITTQDLNGNTLELYIGDFGVIRIVCSNNRDIFVQLLTYPKGPLVLIRDVCVKKPYSEPMVERGYRSGDDDVFGIGDQSPDGGWEGAELSPQYTSAWDVSTPRASTSFTDKEGVAWSGPRTRYDTPFRIADNFSPGAKKFDNTPWTPDKYSPGAKNFDNTPWTPFRTADNFSLGANKFDNTPWTCSAPQKPCLRIETSCRASISEKVDNSPVSEWNGTTSAMRSPNKDDAPSKQQSSLRGGWGHNIATNAFVFKKFDNRVPAGYTPTRTSKQEKSLGLLDLFEQAHRTPPQSPSDPRGWGAERDTGVQKSGSDVPGRKKVTRKNRYVLGLEDTAKCGVEKKAGIQYLPWSESPEVGQAMVCLPTHMQVRSAQKWSVRGDMAD